ncbi:MAG: hypothetical protein M1330_04570 [Armatimonadetes bacterium]|nr:hypothetical protein [Armatimonadota bacterium]
MLPILFFLVFVLVVAATIGYRAYAVAQWDRASRKLDARHRHPRLSVGEITGKVEGRRFRVSTATVYEEGPAYFHTRAVVWCENPAHLVLGLRRKSALEMVTTRRDQSPLQTEDEEFNRRFLVICNHVADLDKLLDPHIRKSLASLESVEIRIKGAEVQSRLPGRLTRSDDIVRLCGLASAIAQRLETLAARTESLSERLADQRLLDEGV